MEWRLALNGTFLQNPVLSTWMWPRPKTKITWHSFSTFEYIRSNLWESKSYEPQPENYWCFRANLAKQRAEFHFVHTVVVALVSSERGKHGCQKVDPQTQDRRLAEGFGASLAKASQTDACCQPLQAPGVPELEPGPVLAVPCGLVSLGSRRVEPENKAEGHHRRLTRQERWNSAPELDAPARPASSNSRRSRPWACPRDPLPCTCQASPGYLAVLGRYRFVSSGSGLKALTDNTKPNYWISES